ncbi:MAG: hypothetical protein ABSF25_15505 [Bryobacteraceae bacterium]|jgi:hypothetical protein
MNLQLIGQLIRLRYQLLWARTRTRNGKIAWFIAGYLLLIMAIMLLALGGLGAGMAAVRMGKAERLAQGLLTALFSSALISSVMLGFGINAAFSDVELRRYPLRERERRFARHFTGAADPFWFLFVALELGLATGLYLLGASYLPMGILAVLLLYVCNYLAAQVVSLLMDRIQRQKGGSIVLPILIMALCFLPSLLMPKLAKNPALAGQAAAALRYTPSFGAGSLMTRTDAGALHGLALLLLWIVGLAVALSALERMPPRRPVAKSTRIRWDSPFDRVSALFGREHGILVAHWLRFYFRARRFRVQYGLSLPLLPFLLLIWTRQVTRHGDPFSAAVGVFAVSGITAGAAFVVNQFGYVGGGFRRYFLFPCDPGAVLRSSSVALLAACAPYPLLATLTWLLFAPVPFDARGLALLLASAAFGMFFFHGLGLWTTLYGPRRCDPNQTMGNDLSLAGNIALIGTMLVFLMGPMMVGQFHKGILTPERWWVVMALAALAVCLYLFSLRRAGAIVVARRERLLAVVEGKA